MRLRFFSYSRHDSHPWRPRPTGCGTHQAKMRHKGLQQCRRVLDLHRVEDSKQHRCNGEGWCNGEAVNACSPSRPQGLKAKVQDYRPTVSLRSTFKHYWNKPSPTYASQIISTRFSREFTSRTSARFHEKFETWQFSRSSNARRNLSYNDMHPCVEKQQTKNQFTENRYRADLQQPATCNAVTHTPYSTRLCKQKTRSRSRLSKSWYRMPFEAVRGHPIAQRNLRSLLLDTQIVYIWYRTIQDDMYGGL